jgi:DNA-binding NtrC family response regulator
LANEVKEGRFREDLYYRLLGLQIALPPLNERGNDIILLCKHFIDDYCKENKVKKITMSNDAQKKLFNYHFPGNIRELKAIIELACVMCNNGVIEAADLTFNSEKSLNNMLVQEMSLDDYNNLIIKNYLEKYDNNVLTVAKKLNIGKSTIYRMLKAETAEKKNKN